MFESFNKKKRSVKHKPRKVKTRKTIKKRNNFHKVKESQTGLKIKAGWEETKTYGKARLSGKKDWEARESAVSASHKSRKKLFKKYGYRTSTEPRGY